VTLTHDQKQALRTDLDRIRRFLGSEFDRNGSRGLALFVDGLDNFWRPLPLTEAVRDCVMVSSEFFLTPLVPLVGRGDGALVAMVSREQGHFFRLRDGRLEEILDRSENVPNQHSQGGWSQARYQRHVDEKALDHMRRVADELERLVRGVRGAKVVLVCPEEQRSEFEGLLAADARSAIVGATAVEAHAGPAQVLDAVAPLLERSRAEDAAVAVERWREEAGRNGRATAGWSPTLEAASDGRVDVLLYEDGVERAIWRCPACGRLASDSGKCPLDGTTLERRDSGLDLAIHQTLAHGGTVTVVRERRDLEPVEGVGALLRF
jgi:peptide chain release factor subunit 1